jgi:hypothetical protein
MKAFVSERYGPPEGLRMAEVEKPTPVPGEALVKVLAVSVNPADWRSMRAKPFFSRAALGWLRPKLDRANRRRRIKKAFMDHLAFVPDPAYVSAGVLNVRRGGAPAVGFLSLAATPALDELVDFMQARKG